MPREYGVRFALLNSCQHVIENWTARLLGCLPLFEDLDNVKMLFGRKLVEFRKLIVDASHLS